MTAAPSHRQFFGDRERTFALPPEMVMELERIAGRGVGGLCRALFAGDFHHREIIETIRLGLIGGGTDPEEAAALVAAYAAPRPLVEIFPLALTILEVLWFGQPAAPDDDREGYVAPAFPVVTPEEED